MEKNNDLPICQRCGRNTNKDPNGIIIWDFGERLCWYCAKKEQLRDERDGEEEQF